MGIRIRPLGADWQTFLGSRLRHWFFEQEFSPRTSSANAARDIDEAIDSLRFDLGAEEAYEILVSPPMWYDCSWQDFALCSATGRWLLHLGFSD